ncbi:cytochrome c family protein [Inquilinus sp. Marseille-Q2685]|uniref:c-type cytochrome n=1 Tax=Inquilinus sp. Marseille-Q2685 TaxID=2866581 RepID=UPI001CE4A9AE|nr:cytochrome c family protein [Inquilinus sp. Marseille-Q2685]
MTSKHLAAGLLGGVFMSLCISAAARAADPQAGARVFNQCKACHALEAGTNKVGPSLHGLFGRTAGTVDGFKYSDAMKGSGLVWDEEALHTYLSNPRGAVPGTKMVFPGIKNPQQLDDLVAYLKEATK